jgi:hypothetical protein
MKTKLYLILIVFIFISCKSYEKLGNFKYRVTVSRVNTSDFDGLIEYIKSYRDPISDTILFGYTIKTQRLHFERNQDTVYARETLKFNPKNKNIICVEIFENGYQHYLKMDSLVRRFTQNKDGSINLIESKEYKGGILIKRNVFN